MCPDGEQRRDGGLGDNQGTAVPPLGPGVPPGPAVAAGSPDPYITSLLAKLPEGWELLSWGTEDG